MAVDLAIFRVWFPFEFETFQRYNQKVWVQIGWERDGKPRGLMELMAAEKEEAGVQTTRG